MEKLMRLEDILRMQISDLQAENKGLAARVAELEADIWLRYHDSLAEQVRLEMCGD